MSRPRLLNALVDLETAIAVQLTRVAGLGPAIPIVLQPGPPPRARVARAHLFTDEAAEWDEDLPFASVARSALERARDVGSAIAHEANELAPAGVALALHVAFVRRGYWELGARLEIHWALEPVAQGELGGFMRVLR